MRKGLMTILLMVLLPMVARAQYDPEFAHYFDMEPSFNPASVGKEPKLNIRAAYAIQMGGFTRNPNTMYAEADLPFYFLKTFHGVGAQMMNDQIGLFRHTRLEAAYAPKIKLFGGTLSVGVQAGLLSESFDGSKLDLEDASDPAFATSEVEGNQLDLSAGLYYNYKRFSIGASVQHVNAPKVELGEHNELKIDRTYYLNAAYDVKFRVPYLLLKPTVMLRTDLHGYRADITSRLFYTHENRVLYAGLGYSPMNSVTMFLGGRVKGMMLGYSFEYYTSALGFAGASHELVLGYQLDMNFTKKGRNLHKSVRIL